MVVSWLSSSSKFNFEWLLVIVVLLAAAQEVSTQKNPLLLQPGNGIRTRRFSARSQETPKSEICVPYQCADGYFGWHCKFQCQCATDGEVCDKRTGFCPSGCAGNNWGPGCLLDSSCYYDLSDSKKDGGFKYAGKVSGYGTFTCNLWTDPNNRLKLNDDDVPEMNLHLAKNYCRNSKRHSRVKPWCNSDGGYIYCGIQTCDCPDYRFDGQNNCDKDCRCRDSNEVCNKETGACTSGCSVGWGGTGCQDCTLGEKPSATSTATSIAVSWNSRLCTCNRSGVQGIQYVLQYTELHGNTWESINRSGEDCGIKCEVTVSNLLPDMVYLVRVRIRKDDNQPGPFLEDEITRVKTMCGKPRRLNTSQFHIQEVSDSNRIVIRVTWNKITDQDWKCLDGREIEIRYKNGTDAAEVIQTVAANARYKDFDTAACTHWSIQIKLSNQKDNSGFSRANSITISRVEPSEVPVLTTQQLNDQGSIKFMCSGQLGRPAKGITWYQTLNYQQQNRTSDAQSSDPVLNSDGCTYNGQSELRADVSASDDGTQFTCMIGQKWASVSLTAASNPKITYISTGALSIIDSAMDSVEFVKGSAVTLICSATGHPQPNFKWLYWEELSNTKEVLNGHRDNPSVLYLDHIQQPGYYECQASNIVNQLHGLPSKVLKITLSEPATGATVGGLLGEAIGGMIGAILGVTVMIALAYVTYTYCVKKKHKTRGEEKVSQRNNVQVEAEDSELQTFLSGEFKPMGERLYAAIKERDVEIRLNIKLMEKIGNGAFSQVFRGSIFNLDGKQNWSIVAVKTAKDTSDTSLYSEIMKELKVMLELQPHPNVVRLLGSCTRDDAVPLIIVEYLPNGNLQDYLRNDRSKRKVQYRNLHGISSSLTPHDLIKFALDVANGMSYLSSMAILHRDLAARNILVAEDRTCKISDFGFAKDVIESHKYEKQSQGRLPIRWMSPEALFDNIYTTQSDVWAYGVLLWEIVTLGFSPYPGMSAKQVMEALSEGYRMPQPPHCSQDMYIIMLSCWEEVPSSRSTFKDIVNSLDVLLASESDVLTLGKFEEKLYEDIDNNKVKEKC